MNERTHNPFDNYQKQDNNSKNEEFGEEFGKDFQNKKRDKNDSPNKRNRQK